MHNAELVEFKNRYTDILETMPLSILLFYRLALLDDMQRAVEGKVDDLRLKLSEVDGLIQIKQVFT